MNLDELKSKLSEFVRQNSITNFEAEDIIELVAEGESIDWIFNQLKSNTPIDAGAITPLLAEIKNLVAPEKEAAGEKEPPAEAAVKPEAAAEPEKIDLSQLDLNQISGQLPPGVNLPPNISTKQIKDLLESPQGKIMADFIVFCQEKGIDLDSGNPNDPRMARLQKEWMSEPRDAFDGKTPAEMLSAAQGKIETFRREDPRVGRNDPCPCGSGKKYKKCCGRA
jgi:hypothetical protein